MPLLPDDIARLYDAHSRTLVTYFARRVYDAEAAVDLTAETFAQAFVSRAGYRGAPTDEDRMRWIYGIARHQVAGFYRAGRVEREAMAKLGVERRDLHDAEIERIEDLAELEGVRSRIARELERMPADQAEVLRLRVIDELGYDEIAGRLAITETTARARVSRALRALAARIEPYLPAEEGSHA